MTLRNLLKDNDLVQASLLAFKLNKLRDFFHAMSRLVSGRAPPNKPFQPGMHNAPVLDKSQDPVDSILQSQSQFEDVQQSNQALITAEKKGAT